MNGAAEKLGPAQGASLPGDEAILARIEYILHNKNRAYRKLPLIESSSRPLLASPRNWITQL